MALYIDNKRLIPIPLVNISKTANFSEDGRQISSTYEINLEGTLLPNRGSPLSTGWYTGSGADAPSQSFSTEADQHKSIMAKQEYLREAFSQPGYRLFYDIPGTQTIDCNPITTNISFAANPWVIKSDYSISLRSDILNRSEIDNSGEYLLNSSGLYLSSVGDSWTLSDQDIFDGGYNVSRTVSAVGSKFYGSGVIREPWENAKIWVTDRISNSGIVIPIPTGINYNIVQEETIDRLGGSYSVSLNYIHNNKNYTEERTVSRNIQYSVTDENAPAIINIGVRGLITGLGSQSDPSGRLVNAYSYWNSLQTILGTLVGASNSPTAVSLDENYNNGTLSYSVDYISVSGSERSLLSYQTSYQNGVDTSATLTINGTISGYSNDGFSDGKWQNAVSGWAELEPTLRSLAFTDAGYLYSTIASGNFSTYPLSKTTSIDKNEGAISFNYVYGTNLYGGTFYTDEYIIRLDTENAPTVTAAGNPIRGSIEGTIRGLASGEDPTARFNHASSGWQTVQSLLYTRVNADFPKIGTTSLTLGASPVTKSVSMNRAQGTIQYSADFSTGQSGNPSGVASLDLSIDEQLQNDVFVEQAIPGRLIGPIIQDIETLTSVRRTINIGMTLYPNNGNQWTYAGISTPRGIANNLIASGVYDLGARKATDGYYLAADSDRWDWRSGLYTRTTSVVYVPSGV